MGARLIVFAFNIVKIVTHPYRPRAIAFLRVSNTLAKKRIDNQIIILKKKRSGHGPNYSNQKVRTLVNF
jgi:hypothetical protein